MTSDNSNVNPPYKLDELSFRPGSGSEVYTGGHGHSGGRGSIRKSQASHSHSRMSPMMGRRPDRPSLADGGSGYYDFQRRGSMHGSTSRNIENGADLYGSRGSLRQNKDFVRSIPRAPSFGQRPNRSRSFASSTMSPRSHSAQVPSHPLPPLARPSALSEKHTPPPYDIDFGRMAEDDADDELVEMIRIRRIKRIVKYSLYAVLAVLIILACSLTAYFLSPRSPVVALHGVDSPEHSTKKFKLQGSKMQFHVELTYRVQNDNYFDMTVDDISSAVFWPETKYALGGGRLSNIRVPARKIIEITMPITIRYDVKRGPPPILLGMVESCGLHDAGIGEMNLEAEVQADFHTKMKQASLQSGRQSISVKCPVRRMATLQVDDGTSGNLGDIVRTLHPE
ncbi:hypothetical protein LPJ73_002101 [Coemansia sp. RSA 2703]|nr:hypothetical protein LPJ73_002101 [Coemansia sp. RSA 2703]